jgi:hypothetical protein
VESLLVSSSPLDMEFFDCPLVLYLEAQSQGIHDEHLDLVVIEIAPPVPRFGVDFFSCLATRQAETVCLD